MNCYKVKQRQIYRNMSTVPTYTVYAHVQKRSAKGFNFKEDKRALPL